MAGQGPMSPARPIFVDETDTTTDIARRYGRLPRGLRLDSSVPYGDWKSITFVGAFSNPGDIRCINTGATAKPVIARPRSLVMPSQICPPLPCSRADHETTRH